MALYEKFPEFDDFDDEFVENEEESTAEAEIQPLPGQPQGVVRTAGIAVDDALGSDLSTISKTEAICI